MTIKKNIMSLRILWTISLTFLIYHLLFFFWSSYDGAASLDLINYIKTIISDYKSSFNFIKIKVDFLSPLVISLFIIEIDLLNNYFFKKNKDGLSKKNKNRITFKLILFILIFIIFIYFCGPIVFYFFIQDFFKFFAIANIGLGIFFCYRKAKSLNHK
ncbi:MAG TPA: hypothetical protein DCS13_10300 [Candidatus Margulisbacteria bacterium]|nr:MAG: hypothetical protein A2X43_11975 [Candidatus Margulisbacteria bacterium GWD2_39_127]OGI10179.1 MAG: hypothetical protein A2X41_01220 [Candidatus Margulisbacteria bacterium GWE2_39_32]HAR63845.1 hypothetical protein [Candidatus Margulisiibacteriota bacterium]